MAVMGHVRRFKLVKVSASSSFNRIPGPPCPPPSTPEPSQQWGRTNNGSQVIKSTRFSVNQQPFQTVSVARHFLFQQKTWD
jgi:hypothetical protein